MSIHYSLLQFCFSQLSFIHEPWTQLHNSDIVLYCCSVVVLRLSQPFYVNKLLYGYISCCHLLFCTNNNLYNKLQVFRARKALLCGLFTEVWSKHKCVYIAKTSPLQIHLGVVLSLELIPRPFWICVLRDTFIFGGRSIVVLNHVTTLTEWPGHPFWLQKSSDNTCTAMWCVDTKL